MSREFSGMWQSLSYGCSPRVGNVILVQTGIQMEFWRSTWVVASSGTGYGCFQVRKTRWVSNIPGVMFHDERFVDLQRNLRSFRIRGQSSCQVGFIYSDIGKFRSRATLCQAFLHKRHLFTFFLEGNHISFLKEVRGPIPSVQFSYLGTYLTPPFSNIEGRLRKDQFCLELTSKRRPQLDSPDMRARGNNDHTCLGSFPYFEAARGVWTKPRGHEVISS